MLEDSGDQVVREGDTVSLWCKVSGIPYPKVTWFRKFAHDQHTAKEGNPNIAYFFDLSNVILEKGSIIGLLNTGTH